MTLMTQGSAPLRRKRGAALEQAILAAAFAELSEAGYAQFSVESVAARAKTGKASIYRRWPNRIELILDALIDQLPTAQQCGAIIEFDDDVSTADALRRIGYCIADILASPAGDVMRAVKCEAAADPTLARAIDERFQAPRRAAMLGLLQRGVVRGEVRPDAVTPLVADVLPAMITYHVILQRSALSHRQVADIIDRLVIPLVQQQ